tara:strand:- start:385 stop:900 length:516 start_codon:yes stop_codon:yes gene_type:complete
MGRWYVGIDPGNQGAIVGLGPDDEVVVVPGGRPVSLAWAGDSARYAALLEVREHAKDEGGRIAFVVLEEQSIRSGQRAQAKAVREQGMWEGWLMAHGIPYGVYSPRGKSGWRALLGKGSFKRTEDTKAWAHDLCTRRLPNLDPHFGGKLRKWHDGVCDAAAMALAARAAAT